jgi:hypothetical protein
MSSAQKIHASTQKFTEIVDFVDNVVVLEGGNACMIIEITASNFALLSQKEQEARVYSYAAFLNSLTFTVQILIRNKRMDITSYLKELDDIIKTTKNQKLGSYIKYYRAFVQEMVTINVVLNKDFYIIIPYTSLETGMKGARQTLQKSQKGQSEIQEFAQAAKKVLQIKADSLLSQLQKFSMSARILEKDDLIKLFYNIYNEGLDIDVEQLEPGVNANLVTGGANK